MTAPHSLDSHERPTNIRWLVFSLACGTSWMLYLHRYTWNIIRPQLQEEYGFSNTQLETLGSIFYFGYAIFQIPSGIVSDLFGTHLFLGSITITWAICLPLLGLVGTFTGLALVRILFGSAQAGGYPALGQVTRTWFPLRSRTQVQGWVASFFGRTGGAFSSVIMATVLMGMFGLSWRWALAIMAGVGILFALAFFATFRNSPEEDPRVNEAELALIREGSSPDAARRGVMPFGKAIRHRTLQVLVGQQFCNAGADIIYTNVMGSYFISQGVTMGTTGILVMLPLLGGAVGGVFGGYLNDWLIRRTGNRRWSRTAVGFSGKVLATAMLFIAISQRTPMAIALWLFVVKFFTDWSQPTVWGTCTDIGGRYSATVFSINNTSGNVGALVIPPLLVGPLLDFYSTSSVVNGETVVTTDFTPMFVVMGILYMLAAVCWFAIDCTKPIEPETTSTGQA